MAKKKVLVVDDEEAIVELLKTRFAAGKYEVVSASNGSQALSKVKEENPDIIVLDVMMPPPNGYQVCRTLKDDPDYKNIPIILLTAKNTSSDEFWGMESGADAYMTKPYNGEELMAKVKSLLEKNA